jgi:carbamoyltransferase
MEFGHRALGNRSILADPRKKEMKDIINSKVKFREEYRPFAPSILGSHLKDYFDAADITSYDFMIETLNAKPLAKESVPAVVHEDGTSRVQTVSEVMNGRFYNLINEFYKITNCPMLLNTSFNLNGMPIVLNFNDAINCFVNSEIDYLVVGDNLIWKLVP